jgi:hypothetical protein
MSRPALPDAVDATRDYERWLGGFAGLNRGDLAHKHRLMAQEPFAFLRATFYRWIQLWPRVCADLAGAPTVLAVGDLHVENFGTWRDSEGRLALGINDFDEASPLPYTNDLVRLATSALLAIREDHLRMGGKAACRAILRGYQEAIESEGSPLVIEDKHHWFLPLFDRRSRTGAAAEFWTHLREALASQPKSAVPAAARTALLARLPVGSSDIQVLPRQAGVGSLGKPRFIALAHWAGAPIAREIKALAPSACVWNEASDKAARKGQTAKSYIPELIRSTVEQGLRCPDPFFFLDRKWVTRRLACDSRKIELKASPAEPDETRLLEAMGRETANVHLASKNAGPRIRKDLAQRNPKWLRLAAQTMLDATVADQKAWRSRFK